jgi:hypothetical protein
MRVDLVALYADFVNQGKKVDSEESALSLVETQYGVSVEEIGDIHTIGNQVIADTVDNPKLFKKNPNLFKNLLSVFITAYFFGMYVKGNKYWDK